MRIHFLAVLWLSSCLVPSSQQEPLEPPGRVEVTLMPVADAGMVLRQAWNQELLTAFPNGIPPDWTARLEVFEVPRDVLPGQFTIELQGFIDRFVSGEFPPLPPDRLVAIDDRGSLLGWVVNDNGALWNCSLWITVNETSVFASSLIEDLRSDTPERGYELETMPRR